VNETESQAVRDKFAERVLKVSSEEQKQDFLFRVMANRRGQRGAGVRLSRNGEEDD
jgi:tRNA(Ser,Leu) C12 N-acetylase TAN1